MNKLFKLASLSALFITDLVFITHKIDVVISQMFFWISDFDFSIINNQYLLVTCFTLFIEIPFLIIVFNYIDFYITNQKVNYYHISNDIIYHFIILSFTYFLIHILYFIPSQFVIDSFSDPFLWVLSPFIFIIELLHPNIFILFFVLLSNNITKLEQEQRGIE